MSAIVSLLLLNSSSWMLDNKNVLYNRNLYEISLPGTHDSGSYNITGNKFIDIPLEYQVLINLAKYLGIPIDKLVKGWTQTQLVNITQQLNLGIRYLDLRICFYNDTWYIHHNFIIGLPLITILKQIEEFLIINQGEIVIIELSHIYNETDKNIEILNKTINDNLSTFTYKNKIYKNETIGELIGLGQRLIIVTSSYIFISNNFLLNTWANTPNIDSMIQYNNNILDEWKKNTYTNLLKMSWTLTPDINTILEGYFTNNTLYKLEKNINNIFLEWIKKQESFKNKCPIFPNILLIDYILDSTIVYEIVKSLYKC